MQNKGIKMGMKSRSSSTLSLDFQLMNSEMWSNCGKDGKKISVRQYVLSIVTAAIIALVMGVLIGNASISKFNKQHFTDVEEKLNFFERLVDTGEDAKNGVDEKRIMEEISSSSIKSFHRNFTKYPRMAGTQSGRIEAEKMKRLWLEHGIPKVDLNPFDVLLSYPDGDNPNSVSIIDSDGKITFKSKTEKFSNADIDLGRKISPPFNAYSGSKEVTGDLVYAHYGLREDFEYLAKTLGISLEGKILLIRYGKGSRGKKAMIGQSYNASGIIFYSDPADYAKGNLGVYPKSLDLPPDGAQRGSLSRVRSDILTEGYPATVSAYRISIQEAEENGAFPKIPVFPISYSVAEQLMREIKNNSCPDEWKGNMNASYNIGPGFKDNKKVVLKVGNIKERRIINNVIGVIHGSVEPDRYVIVGNHRDSWTYGGSDPGSATACLAELTRIFGKFYKEGWRPRRTMIFASWDAEEYGYVGSTEWLEENRFILDRAVAYLNIDQAVTGNMSFYCRASPSIREIFYNITKMVENPDKAEKERGRKTVYDTWSVKRPDGSNIHPKINLPSGGSDFRPFIHILGIPSAGFRYCDKSLSNPLYHTKFETFEMQANHIDPSFDFHRAVTRVWALAAYTLLQPILLPYNLKYHIPILKKAYQNMLDSYQNEIDEHRISLEHLEESFQVFYKAIEDFEERKNKVNVEKNPFEIRKMNDQYIRVDRAFIDIRNGVDRKGSQNVLTSYAKHSPKSRLLFGPLTTALWEATQSGRKIDDPLEIPLWNDVRKEVSILTFHIQSASLVLQEIPSSF